MSDSQKDSGVKKQSQCRVCESDTLVEFLNLGDQPLANAFLKTPNPTKKEQTFPLRVLFCQNCNFVQLGEVVDPELMFQDYVYHSSGMPASKHFRDYAESVTTRFLKSHENLVVEIGSNDGHFLEVVKNQGFKILGIDPARNIAKIANERGVPTFAEYFSENVAVEVVKKHGKANLIIANNVFAHIDDLHSVVKGIKKLLASDGVFVIEAPYLVDMFQNLTFDTIYHEHMSYLAVRPLQKLFEKYNLEIFDVQTHPIQGVSLRVFVGHKGSHAIEYSVGKFVEKELALGLDKFESYKTLADKVESLKSEVVDVVDKLKQSGKKIVAYGAPAKGNTLLNYFGIGADVIEYAIEDLPDKVGLYTPGMHIPVVAITEAKKNPPDYFLLLAWNYKEVIAKKVRDLKGEDGKFIMPVGKERLI